MKLVFFVAQSWSYSSLKSQLHGWELSVCYFAGTEDIVKMSKIEYLDVLEWAMEMRENDIMMDLHNLQVKERKQMEEGVKQQREFKARKDAINQHKEKILDYEKCLKEKEAKIKEISTILEIALKLNKKDDRIAIQNWIVKYVISAIILIIAPFASVESIIEL